MSVRPAPGIFNALRTDKWTCKQVRSARLVILSLGVSEKQISTSASSLKHRTPQSYHQRHPPIFLSSLRQKLTSLSTITVQETTRQLELHQNGAAAVQNDKP